MATPQSQVSSPRSEQRLLMLHGGRKLYPVSGESRTQKALGKIVGGLGPDGPAEDRRWCMVDLVPEPENQYDPDAIAVRYRGEHLGYIPKEGTAPYHEFIGIAARHGWDGLSCRACVTGGFLMDGTRQRAHLGLELAHTIPFMIQYDGPTPTIPETDDTKRIDLQGEENYQEFLAGMQYRRILTHLVVDPSGVSAVMNGQVVGRLTPKMSDRYADLILREQARGRGVATCLAMVLPAANKLEVKLKLPSDEGLESWAGELLSVSPGPHPSTWTADWRPDPMGVSRLRYYDGSSWTKHTAD